jgi:hypothetical protein
LQESRATLRTLQRASKRERGAIIPLGNESERRDYQW